MSTDGKEPLAEREQRVRRLVDEHFEFITRSVRRLGSATDEVEDAVQEVFLVATRRLHAIAQGSERAFLFATALRVVSARRRGATRRRTEPRPSLDDWETPAKNPEEASLLFQARALLQQILLEMSLDQRTVFVLFELEELSVPEIANVLSIPAGTVNSRLRRARELFQAASRRLQVQEALSVRRS